MSKKKRITKTRKTNPRQRLQQILNYTDLTNKELAKKIGVSTSTLYRYKTGKTSPRNPAVYQKINRTYNRYKSAFVNYCSIIPDYVIANGLNEGETNIDLLLKLSDSGYCCGWLGDENIPYEVEFLANGFGSPLNNNGYFFNIIAIVGNLQSPKMDKKGRKVMPKEYKYMRIFTVTRGELGIKTNTDFETRLEIIRGWVMANVLEKFHVMPIAVLGYYIAENDII